MSLPEQVASSLLAYPVFTSSIPYRAIPTLQAVDAGSREDVIVVWRMYSSPTFPRDLDLGYLLTPLYYSNPSFRYLGMDRSDSLSIGPPSSMCIGEHPHNMGMLTAFLPDFKGGRRSSVCPG